MTSKQMKAEIKNFEWYIALNTWRYNQFIWRYDKNLMNIYKQIYKKVSEVSAPIKVVSKTYGKAADFYALVESKCDTMIDTSDSYVEAIENKMQQNWKAAM